MIRRTTSLPSRTLLIVLAALGAGLAYWSWGNTSDPAIDLNGTWTLTNQVNSSELKRYMGDSHEFTIRVEQEGTSIQGSGEQTGYNGKAARNRYPIWFTAINVNGEQVVIEYAMKGGRPTEGNFTLQVDPDTPTILRGSFTSTAANTSGTTVVRIER
jgi:hypothetical protein